MTKVKLLCDGGYTEELAGLDYSKTFTATPFIALRTGKTLGYDVHIPELRAAGAVITMPIAYLYFSILNNPVECEVVN